MKNRGTPVTCPRRPGYFFFPLLVVALLGPFGRNRYCCVAFHYSSQLPLTSPRRILREERGRLRRPIDLPPPTHYSTAALHRSSFRLSAIPMDILSNLKLTPVEIPFGEIARDLSNSLDVGSGLFGASTVGGVPEEATGMVLESLGHDLLIFLAASVVVTPLSNILGIAPILGYLIAGALLGPHALDMFSNSKADVELGDFGLLFLLFSEGLEVSTDRLRKLTAYLPLGFAQISLTSAALTAAILFGLPEALEDIGVPLEAGLVNIRNPAEAVVLALAGALSTSAFVFPVLKSRGWEDEDTGQAATSVLLLQDLAVAPLLVILPYVLGQGVTDYGAIGFLTAKATIGFGAVIYLGSKVLRRIFQTVSRSGSTETFVALCLLVSVGMGTMAKTLGLTDTAGAFAAGVLLANTNYRAQIQADILPFKGILLGIFFMDAGSSFDTELVVNELPTVLTGSLCLIVIKATTILISTRVPKWIEPNRLEPVDAFQVALLLSGGGEFAFVVLALAEKLGVLPVDLGGLLTAIVLITMSSTPLLGELAELGSVSISRFVELPEVAPMNAAGSSEIDPNSIVVCGYDKPLLDVLGESAPSLKKYGEDMSFMCNIVAFDTTDFLVDVDAQFLFPSARVMYGDGSNPEVLRSSGVTDPAAIFVAYDNYPKCLDATSRLRTSFGENIPIITRAQTRCAAQSLEDAGATEVVVEYDELTRSAISLLYGCGLCDAPPGEGDKTIGRVALKEDSKVSAGAIVGIKPGEVDQLMELFDCMDIEKAGTISSSKLLSLLRKSNLGVLSDDKIDEMEVWVQRFSTSRGEIDFIRFCQMYARAPE
eukprot:CAMPEP_0194285666 /NCGR_PEP_ID=MMETSP0169-20130528/30720_1 /TAXON_ID=218684 /ORGANISM="Corethron pennatum, Strain L29A3" /LENGTH=824 /DNA_ID=CAMNT_0039031849 /DNA_START=54 /DNA_END=2525 /DNA_ORIENTATION=+